MSGGMKRTYARKMRNKGQKKPQKKNRHESRDKTKLLFISLFFLDAPRNWKQKAALNIETENKVLLKSHLFPSAGLEFYWDLDGRKNLLFLRPSFHPTPSIKFRPSNPMKTLCFSPMVLMPREFIERIFPYFFILFFTKGQKTLDKNIL